MDGKTLARLAAVIFVAVAVIATAIDMNRRDVSQNTSTPRPSSTPRPDPLDAELARCSGIGEAGSRDPACLKAWVENRRRFLGQPASSAPGPQPSSPENGVR